MRERKDLAWNSEASIASRVRERVVTQMRDERFAQRSPMRSAFRRRTRDQREVGFDRIRCEHVPVLFDVRMRVRDDEQYWNISPSGLVGRTKSSSTPP